MIKDKVNKLKYLLSPLNYVYDDGGRSNYFTSTADDCVVRAIAITLQEDYKTIYSELSALMGKGKSPRNGVPKKISRKYLLSKGFEWIPYMQVGQGCTKHLLKTELPKGTYIAIVAKHLTAIKDYTIYDTFKPDSNRCVYGIYFHKGMTLWNDYNYYNNYANAYSMLLHKLYGSGLIPDELRQTKKFRVIKDKYDYFNKKAKQLITQFKREYKKDYIRLSNRDNMEKRLANTKKSNEIVERLYKGLLNEYKD